MVGSPQSKGGGGVKSRSVKMRTMSFKSSEAPLATPEGKEVRRCKGTSKLPKEDKLGPRELLLGGKVEFSEDMEPPPRAKGVQGRTCPSGYG